MKNNGGSEGFMILSYAVVSLNLATAISKKVFRIFWFPFLPRSFM